MGRVINGIRSVYSPDSQVNHSEIGYSPDSLTFQIMVRVRVSRVKVSRVRVSVWG